MLGVSFDSRLGFHCHATAVIQQCAGPLALLSSLRPYVKATHLRVLVDGLIGSRLRYAAAAWWPFLVDGARTRRQSLWYQAARIVTGAAQSSRATSVCYEAGVLSGMSSCTP